MANLPTPFYRLRRAEARWGQDHRIWIKRDDLTGCALTGNKVRKLEFIAAYALDNGYDTLITCGAMQSNHCRATALVGAQLGLKVHLVLAGKSGQSISGGNIFLDKLAGAKISLYDKLEYRSSLDSILLDWKDYYRKNGFKALILPTGGSDGLGIWGYIACAQELINDLVKENLSDANIICATGSGGTQAGLNVGVEAFRLPLAVWGVNVSDSAEHFVRKIGEDIADLQRRYKGFEDLVTVPKVLDGYVGEGYAKADTEVYRLISELASMEGVILDPVYTAKAFLGMIGEIKKGTFSESKDIIFLHTGGIFGLMAQSDSVFVS